MPSIRRGASLLALLVVIAMLPPRAEAGYPRLVDSFGVAYGYVSLSAAPSGDGSLAVVGITNEEGNQSSCVVFTKRQWAGFIHYYNRAVANWSSSFSGVFHLGGVVEYPNYRRTSLDVYLANSHESIHMGFAMRDPKYYESTIVLLDSEDCARFSYAVGRVNRINGW